MLLPSVNRVKITKIKFGNFRRFCDVELEIGDCVTLIAGQNGTSKSTLLGMICQPFAFGSKRNIGDSAYSDNYRGLMLSDHKRITGQYYESRYSDVFRMSKVHDNPTVETPYKYHVCLSGTTITHPYIREHGIYVESEPRESNTAPIRLVAGPGHSHNKLEGNFYHPVIYLGLNRLCPLAICDKIKLETSRLTPEEEIWHKDAYRSILVLQEDIETVQYVKSGVPSKGDFVGSCGSDYDSSSCSAGQDNLSQILTAILSFKRLKASLSDKYQGGLLLIDEVDATLHAVAQEKLLEFLIASAKDCDLQIIATTHSLKKELSKKRHTLLCLPGDDYPEKLLYDFLKGLSRADHFWNDIEYEQVFRDHMVLPKQVTKGWYKDWYKHSRSFFGPRAKKAFECWARFHQNVCHDFCNDFARVLKQVQPTISSDIVDKIRQRYPSMKRP